MNARYFQATWALQQLPVSMKLSNLEWRFLLCADGKASVEAIQARLDLSDPECDSILARLCASNLLTERMVSLDEFAASTVDAPSTAAAHEPQTFFEYLQSAEPVLPADKTLPAFRPLQKPSSSPATVRSMSLQAAIQFILHQTSDPTAGHLATYQVFMGIDTQLLKRNGITSLRFQDDRLITDPELQQAIVDNIKRVLKVNCPEDIFVEVVSPPSR